MQSNKKELTDTERKIFQATEENNIVLLKALLTEVDNVNIVDDNFMSPLQHAAYKGNKEMVQVLLDRGADVNFCEHQHNYTALHFAGLSGNVDVCFALLLSGARTQDTNTVGRTAAQMAAFVGHHSCVALINNYVPKHEVDYYTEINGKKQTEPYLLPFLAESFHKFITQVNVHPVKVILNVQNFVGLSDHLKEIKEVLELMCEKEMRSGTETNVLSFKFHYLTYIIGEIHMAKERQNNSKKDETEDDKKLDITELLTRKLLKPGKDGALEFMDGFLRECIRGFPYRDSTLFRQMVASLAGKDPPSALSVICSAINGQRGFIDNTSVCNTCGEEKPAKKCSKCKVVQYCDRNCQRLHWHWHKKACSRLSQGVIEDVQAQIPRPDPNEVSQDIQNLIINN